MKNTSESQMMKTKQHQMSTKYKTNAVYCHIIIKIWLTNYKCADLTVLHASKETCSQLSQLDFDVTYSETNKPF